MERSHHLPTPQSPGVPAAESVAHRQRSVVRALHLLEELVDETEKKGTGGLRAHGARVRGAKVVVLSFENKVSVSVSVHDWSNNYRLIYSFMECYVYRRGRMK